MMYSSTSMKLATAACMSACGYCAIKLWSKSGESDKATGTTTTTDTADLQLQMVQIFLRHGARTPLNVTPNVEQATYDVQCTTILPETDFMYKERDLSGGPKSFSRYDAHYKKTFLQGGANVGCLTKLGQTQMFHVGQQLRRDYVGEGKLLGVEFDPRHVHVRSTNVQRTIGTARCVLAGMFGHLNLDNLTGYVRSTNVQRTIGTARCVLAGMFGHLNLDNLTEEPVIHIQGLHNDELLPRTYHCEVLKQINHAATVHGGDIPGIAEDREMIEKTLGLPPGEPAHRKINFIFVRDDIVAREAHGHSVPEPLRPYQEMIERHAATIMYYAFCGQHEAERTVAMRLSTGPLIRMVIENMTNWDHSNSHKMFLFSSHDSSLVGVLGTLDIYDNKWPPFGVDVRFELFADKQKQQFVKVSYNGKPVIVRGCTAEMCPLADFRAGMAPYFIRPQQYKEECASNILQQIAKEMMEREKGEVQDAETKERSETPAGM